MANIKTKIITLGAAAAVMLCGCGGSGSDVQLGVGTESSSSVTAAYITDDAKVTEKTEITEASVNTEKTDTAETENNGIGEPPHESADKTKYFEVREYPDDKIVPAEWIPVYSFAEAAKNFGEAVSAEVSKMDTVDAIVALANKNVIYINSFVSYLFWDADMDHPYYAESYKNPFYPDKPIYPITIEYFTDVREIEDLGADIYPETALAKFYTHNEKKFVKENGVTYADLWVGPYWNFQPFALRTYIEIVSETEDKCSFIWHTPDFEKLNEPEEGYEYFYFDCEAEAIRENGVWKLSDLCIEGYTLK